jgi:hypothetical protein
VRLSLAATFEGLDTDKRTLDGRFIDDGSIIGREIATDRAGCLNDAAATGLIGNKVIGDSNFVIDLGAKGGACVWTIAFGVVFWRALLVSQLGRMTFSSAKQRRLGKRSVEIFFISN